MNSPQPPLSRDTLDELLSADIDGEFDRAAQELGFTPAAARAALDATPNVEARRNTLLQARELLAEQTTALEPATEARLVATALARVDDRDATPQPVAHASTHRWRNTRRALVGVGTAAAVIAGIVVLSANNPAGESKSSSAVSSAPTTPALGAALKHLPPTVVFGPVMPPGALHRKVQAALAQQSDQAPSAASTKSAQSPSPNLSPLSADSAGNTAATNTFGVSTAHSDTTRLLACIDTLARTNRALARPVLSGPGTDGAQPVFVVVYEHSASHLVYVLRTADCSVVSRTTLP